MYTLDFVVLLPFPAAPLILMRWQDKNTALITIMAESSKPLKSYTCEDVGKLLVSLKLDKHVAAFKDFGVDGPMLSRMQVRKIRRKLCTFCVEPERVCLQAAHLTEIGLSAMEQLKLTMHIEKLTGQSLGALLLSRLFHMRLSCPRRELIDCGCSCRCSFCAIAGPWSWLWFWPVIASWLRCRRRW